MKKIGGEKVTPKSLINRETTHELLIRFRAITFTSSGGPLCQFTNVSAAYIRPSGIGGLFFCPP